MSYSVIVPFTGFSGWSFLQRTRDQQQEAMNESGQVGRLTANFATRISSVTTAAQLFDDRELREVALSAFGMQDDMESRAFILNVLNSDTRDSDSMANQLADKRYLALAKTFGFGNTSAKPSDDGGLGDDIVAALQATHTSIETSEGANAETLDEALIKLEELYSDAALTDDERWLAAMADSDLKEVLATVLDLPDDYGYLTEAAQLDALRTRSQQVFGVSEITDFATPGLYLEYEMSETFQAAVAQPWSADASFAEAVVGALIGKPLALETGLVDTTELLADGMVVAVKDLAAQEGMTDDERWVEMLSNSSLRKVFSLMLDLPDDFNALDTDAQIAALRDETESFFGVSSFAGLAETEILDGMTAQFLGRMEGLRTADGNFADDIIAAYQDQQFEISVGETDTNLRLALGLERELSLINESDDATNDTRWYSVMSSESLRTVFEKALGLPESFGALDLDLQLKDFKARAEARFGTAEIADFSDPDLLDKLTTQFLVGAEITDLLDQSRSTGQIALDLLSAIPSNDA